MFGAMTRASNKLMQRFLPDPFIFVILLTGVVFLFGLIVTGQSPVKMVSFWETASGNYLSFPCRWSSY